AYVNRGYVLNDLQNAEQATSDFQHALKLEPKNGEAHLGLAFAQLELHHGHAALQQAELAQKYMGESGSVYVAKATAYRQQGLLQQAEKAYRSALQYNRGDLQLTLALADTLFHMRRYDDSVKVLNAALALDSDDPFIYAQMAQAKAELKQRADTFKYVQAAEREGADRSDVLLATGDALLTLGDRDAAMQRFERALDAPDSDRVQARLHIAKLMQRDGNWDEAREQVALAFAESRIGEASPVTAENMLAAGDIFLRMHDFDLAQKLFQRARAAGAADQVVSIALANTYLAQGNTEQAENELASLGNPSDYQENYDYMLARANMLRQQHQDVRAMTAFAHANMVSGEDTVAERQ
ncbi:MAG TPA: tetratricopeptide repeat protein, partial [Rudaea sp.]|nr:tetratricopeptide repeat protein [Rudaea sp.]